MNLQVVSYGINFPKLTKLGYTNASLDERNEPRRILCQGVYAHEFSRSKSLHVDAVTEECVPIQVMLCVGDQNL